MTDREKLIELLRPWLAHLSLCAANDLIANGVTFATDTNDGGKWTPTDERLPEHGDVVLCQHKHFVCPFIFQWDKKHNVWHDDEREYGADYITHWMPLPEPPREG